MERRLSAASRRSAPSPIQQLSHLAQRVGAVNLAEGFPDFPAPPHVKAAAAAAIAADLNQYRHVQGVCDILASTMKRDHGLDVDPLTDFVICCGQSEAFAAAIFAIIDQGDEVLLFDPAYETYETCIELARGVPVYVPLDPPSWTLNEDIFLKSFTSRTKAVVLNSPHNPTGKVFSKEELLIISHACQKMDCFAITDEVYEYITYDANKHISLASLPGMQERTIITSSLSKTYSVTGWRLGWACAAASIASAIRNIHIKLTDSAPAPFQEAALTALTSTADYYTSLKKKGEATRKGTRRVEKGRKAKVEGGGDAAVARFRAPAPRIARLDSAAMASSLDAWVKEYNEASRLADDINSMIAERGSLPQSGPEVMRHTSAIRRKITILGMRLDSLAALFARIPPKSLTDKEMHKRQDMLSNLQSKAKQMATSFNMSNFANREDLLGQSKKADDMSRVAGLDNQGIVGLQRQIMKEQDEGLERLEETVLSTKHIALAVNEELTLHTRLIDDLEELMLQTRAFSACKRGLLF